MRKFINVVLMGVVLAVWSLLVPQTVAAFETDTIDGPEGGVKITFIGHASLIFEYKGKVVYVDPWSELADFSKLPKADLILITHEHPDHLDMAAIKAIIKDDTIMLANRLAAEASPRFAVMKNGDRQVIFGIGIKAVPAYNLVNMRSTGKPWHAKGDGNGYVLTFGQTKIYVAGDTENIPEMSAIQGVNVAFLPMNLPYTMTPEMVVDAVKKLKPQIVYPYHYGNTDPEKLVKLMKGMDNVEVRIRSLR